jgi:hypothetical protein
MRRFAIFATVLFVLVVVGSRQRAAASSQSRSLCVCMASKAELLMKSITTMSAKATTQAPSQPQVTETASAAE